MKTKISHLGRSTVSVILAVMMLLSTMLIGTVSTVNAIGANSNHIVSKGETLYLDLSNTGATGANFFQNNYIEGNDYFYPLPPDKIISVKLSQNIDFSNYSSRLYSINNVGTNKEWFTQNNDKNILPSEGQNMVVVSADGKSYTWGTYSATDPVAESVTLTANPTSITEGGASTLTATLKNKNSSGDVTYTFTDASGTTVGTKITSDSYASIQVNPTATTTYTVTVSADGYSDVTGSTTVAMPESTTLNFMVRSGNTDISKGVFKKIGNDEYILDVTFDQTGDYSFYVKDDKDNIYYRNQTGTLEDLISNVTLFKYGTNNDEHYVTLKVANPGTYGIKMKASGANYSVSLYKIPDTSVTYTVNYGVNGGNGTLTADGVTTGSAVNSGTKVTFTAHPNKGYTVEGWYSDADCTKAITDAGNNTSYEVTVNANTDVYVKFKSTTIDPEYRLTGDLSAIGGWKGYGSALKFDTAESDGSYSKIITVTNEDINSKYFKLIKSENGSDEYYGPNEGTYDIINSNSSVTAYNTFKGSGSGSDFYFSKSGTYKIHYFVKPDSAVPSIWVEENTTKYNVTVAESIKSIATVDKTEVAKGETVTVTVNPDSGKVLQSVTVEGDDKKPVTTNVSGNKATFTMPDQNVIVTSVIFRDAKTYTVTFSSSNDTFGTVSAKHNGADFTSGETVNVGDTVIFTANPKSGYALSDWTVTANGTSNTYNDSSLSLKITANTTVTASFTEAAPYQVAYGLNGTLMRMNKTKYDGVYISTGTIVSSPNDNNPNSHFTIYDTANNQYASISASGYYWLKDDNLSKTMGEKDYWKDKYIHGKDKGLINNACSSAKYVVYNANTKTITLTDDPDYGTKATLYVKNGTYSTSFDTGNTKDYAKSSVAAGLNATKTDPCNTYSVAFDTNVNVQTTLTDKYRKAGYYVGAYCVNGRNYPASAKNADQGIYQANITITEDLAENCVVEVTPVYYNRVIEQNGDYITFYVDADQATKDWGSTISVDAYSYKDGDKAKGELHAFGTYPGQPMVKDGQYYVIKVPRYYYEVSADGTLTIDTNSPISGVTLNNYNNEKIHGSLVPIKRNMQTYDFSDFVALANKEDVKTIMFQSKFYNATGNANRNTSVVFNTAGEIKNLNPKSQISNIGDAATIKVNPYEDFTDYYGRATDLIGNILDDNQKDDANNLYVISTGSYNNQSTVYSTKGQWVTIWNVYDHNGNLITYGTPADFLNENTSQYKKIADKYKGKPVKISYEKGLSYDKGVTSRTDGRWYYSTLGQEFTSDVAIEYKHQNDKVYTADTDSNAGNNTGFVGETTKATATINNVTTASFSSVTETAHLNIKVANGWRFDGWFIKQGDKYTKVSDSYTDISTDVLMSNSYHIVACISEIPSGTLELNHTAYTGTDPAAHTGTGFYYISAVLKKDGAPDQNFAETQGKISIDNFAATDSLEITLRAKCHGDNTVYALYKGEAGGYTEIGTGLNGKSEFTYTVTVSAGSLFENGKLAVNALNYYTDIVKVGGTCDITYMYKDRFGVEGEGKMVSYVVRNVELSTYEITHGYIPTDETITKYAPRIDTMYLETKWNLKDAEKVKKGRSQATVIATQTPKTCNVYYPVIENGYYGDVIAEKPYVVDYNSLLMDEGGNFLLSAPKTDENGNQFSYWDVYKANKNGGNTGELVTKCYEHNFGLRIMADYYIVPVYNEKAPTLTANINAPVLNREIYGDSANPKDKLYADLLTAFTSTAIPTFKENKTDLKVECGVFVVRNNTSTLSVDDRNTLVNAAATGGVDTTSDILAKKYKMIPQVETEVKSQLEKLAVDSSVKNNTNNTYKFGSDDYRVTKFVFDNDSLTNKNRIDKVLRYTNNTANQNYIFTAYAFVVIKDSNGEVKDKCISESQYFNLCYVGNKALDNN